MNRNEPDHGLPRPTLWPLIAAERARLLALLQGLDAGQWSTHSWCTDWTVEQTTAHLTAAAVTGPAAWIWSIVRAGFRPDVHNARQLARRLGDSPAGTMSHFACAVDATIAPNKDVAGMLGEVVVHGQDIARALGLSLEPDPEAVLVVARFFASKNFAVQSRTMIAGLRLQASDADFSVGEGPLVQGRLLDLVLAMARRPQVLGQVTGDGVAGLSDRMG